MEQPIDMHYTQENAVSPCDYQDAHGHNHVMCACGHWVTTKQPLGTKIAVCPNCAFSARFGIVIPLVWPDKMP